MKHEHSTSNVQRPTSNERLSAKQSFPPAWLETEPPKDGTPICAIGRVIYSEEFTTTVDPFFANIVWRKTESGYEGWLFHSNGMSLAQFENDEIKIDHWFAIPFTDRQSPAP